ncbi:unnamed protein product [Calypogeia fissa]
MERQRVPIVWAGVFGATVLLSCVASVSCLNVTYDNRALIIDGKRRFLQSGSIHYPRSTPQMWPKLLDYAKQGGIDVIQTYVFWDIHEPHKGTYNFAGRFDLVKFIKECAVAGLYVNLRIGPYVCAEWNFGGFPAWLRFVPNIEFRTENDAFKAEMARFVTDIVNMMKDQQLFAYQGGPIILAQIENEYGNVDTSFGKSAFTYIQWAADLAESFDVGVPWIMCQQKNAPGDIINTCNGFYCEDFIPNSPTKPKFWTENWAGWFQNWGRQLPSRPAEDVAFAVARFFARGGSYQNYYMYHGGTNFGRTAGQWITTSYDYDAPLDQFGQPRQPKWGHLRDTHAAIKLCEPSLAAVDKGPFYLRLGPAQEAYVYADYQGATLEEILSRSTTCAAFISNQDTGNSNTKVQFGDQLLDLPPWSVSILPDCKSVVHNTAMVSTQSMVMKMVPSKTTNPISKEWSGAQDLEWSFYDEPPFGTWAPPSNSTGLQEQINVTLDTSDYLWYTTSFLQPEDWTGNLVVGDVKDTLHVFVNGEYAGSPPQTFQTIFKLPLNLPQGNNTISVLSATLGLQNYGAFLEKEDAGIGLVQLSDGSSNGLLDLTKGMWQYQVGMQGEKLNLFTVAGLKSVPWQSGPAPVHKALVWYKTVVDAPAGDLPVALDLGSMGKGQAWINGNSIGRFWTIPQSSLNGFQGGTCPTSCDYRGEYDPSHCTLGCGDPSQRWYHVPRDWLQPTNNLLVIFEEAGGDVRKVALVTQAPDKVCAQMSEAHPARIFSKAGKLPGIKSSPQNLEPPTLHLDCTPGHNISEVVFGSFGNPSGTCGSFQRGSCHAPLSAELLHLACVGRQQCFVEVSWTIFAVEDPCPTILKGLAVEALCTPTGKATQ